MEILITMFASFVGFVGGVILITEFVNKLFKVENSRVKWVISWVLSIGLAAVGFWQQLGFFAACGEITDWLGWVKAILIGVGCAFAANKTYDANNKILTEPKTLSSKRDVYVQEELREIIDKIREYVKRQNEIFGVETDIFFPDPEGGRLKYYSYSTYLREVSERVLGRRITPHTLRHTHCSMLAAKGMNLEAISARLGHDDSRITKEIYFHRLEEMKEKENRQLDGIKLLRKA